MSTETQTFKLDLDNAEFLAKALEGKNAVLQIGDSGNLSGLVESLSSATIAIGVVGAAAYALKTSLDMTLEGENIERISNTFNTLAKNAGLAGDALKEGIVKAAGGMASESEILQAANQAMIGLGDSASKLPQLMDLARKATAVYGGTLIDNFRNISEAVSVGNTRILKHYGIVVDTAKAHQDFAEKLGVTSGELSEAGKRTAVLEAVLEKSKTAYAGVSGGAGQATTALLEFKAAVTEAKEVLDLLFANALSQRTATFFSMLKQGLMDAKTWLQATFGTGAEQAAAGVDLLNARIADTKKKLDDITNHTGIGATMTTGEAQIQVQLLTAQLKKYEEELGKAQVANQKFKEDQKKEDAAKPKAKVEAESKVDYDKKERDEAKFNSELIQMKRKYNDEALAMETDLAKADQELAQKKLFVEEETQAKIRQIRANENLTDKQKAQLESQTRKSGAQEFAKLEQERQSVHERVANNMAKKDATTAAGFVNGFKGATLKAKVALEDWAKVGEQSANLVSGTMVAGFKAIGDGSESATTAMKNAFLKSLGDMAVEKGSMMLLEGLWPPNPVELAAGGALVALGSSLGAMASKPSAGGGGSIGGGGGGNVFQTGAANQAATQVASPLPSDQTNQGQHKTVTVNFQGDFLSTDQTRQQLMDMMRKETDATDFKYVQVGR